MSRHVPLPTLDNPDPSPSPSSPDQAAASCSPDHLDSIEVEQLEAEAAPPAAEGLPIGADGLLSAEAFAAGLRHALTLGGHLTGLQALLASPEAPTFPDAARGIYETLRELPALHFLIRPGGLWIQRAAAILVWAVPVGAACRAELRARQAVPVQESSESAA